MHLSRLSLNSLWLLFARIGSQLGMVLFTILLARGLGSQGFGDYAFIASVIVIGNVLTTFGTDMHLIREIAATNDLSSLPAALVLQLLLSIPFVFIVFVGSALVPSLIGTTAAALRLYSLSMLPLAFFTVFTIALRGRQHMLAYALLSLASMLLQVGVGAWVYWRAASLMSVAALLLGVQIATALLAGLICVLKVDGFSHLRGLALSRLIPLTRASAPVALLGLLGIIYQRLVLVLLPLLASGSAAGWFSAASRLVEAAKLGHLAILTALYPMMAASRLQGTHSWSRTLRRPALVLLGGAVFAAVVLYLLAPALISRLYGSSYLESIAVVRILAWVLVPYAWNSFLTLALLARGEEASIGRALGLSLLALILLSWRLLPVGGPIAAAWTVVTAELVQSAALLFIDLRRTRILPALLRAQPALS